MSRSLTASDRTALIRLASSLPKGSPERKVILAGLKKANHHDGKHVHIFGYSPKDISKVELLAKDFGGRPIDGGVELDAEGDPQDWSEIKFPSFEDAQAFVQSVDWKRVSVRMHYKDAKIFGVGLFKF